MPEWAFLCTVFAQFGGVPSVLIQIAPGGDDKIHTNSMESFWSLLERGTKGTSAPVEPVHLFQFLNEQAFRFINRTGRERSNCAISGIVHKRLAARGNSKLRLSRAIRSAICGVLKPSTDRQERVVGPLCVSMFSGLYRFSKGSHYYHGLLVLDQLIRRTLLESCQTL